jgi:purine-binding chemotaxis protein CheW
MMENMMNAIANTAELSEDEILDQMYLIFSVNTESYGVKIEHVTEIVGVQKIIQVPDVPNYVKGVINLRGSVIPVIDIRMRFNMSERCYDDRTVIIVLEHQNIKTGLIVDGVNDVTEISDAEISSPPQQGASKKSSITGVGQKQENIYFLLDVAALRYAETAIQQDSLESV